MISSTFAIFTVEVKSNTLPIFATASLPNVTVPLKTTHFYSLPAIKDTDIGQTSRISAVIDKASGTLPSFITFNNVSSSYSLTINPTVMTEVKTYTIIVIITDSIDTNQYQFQLTVTNRAP